MGARPGIESARATVEACAAAANQLGSHDAPRSPLAQIGGEQMLLNQDVVELSDQEPPVATLPSSGLLGLAYSRVGMRPAR